LDQDLWVGEVWVGSAPNLGEQMGTGLATRILRQTSTQGRVANFRSEKGWVTIGCAPSLSLSEDLHLRAVRGNNRFLVTDDRPFHTMVEIAKLALWL
jgi:hypothetical protein